MGAHRRSSDVTRGVGKVRCQHGQQNSGRHTLVCPSNGRQGRSSMHMRSVGIAVFTALLLSGTAFAQEKIKVGVTATLEGTYTVLGEDGIRGFQTALNTLGKKVGD